MKAKKKQKMTQNMTILHDYLALVAQESNKRVQTFFQLLYVQEPPSHILLQNPMQILRIEEKEAFDVYEACAILLACNEQNQETFMKIPSFTMLCSLFSSRFDSLPAKYHQHYIQCLQASILYTIDSKAMRAITKHTKALREHGIIGFHEQKCIETALQIELVKTQTSTIATQSQATSFIHLSPAKTPFKNQLDAIAKAKKILKKVAWASKLSFLCEEDLTKKVTLIGAQKTGKSTLLAAMLYDSEKSAQSNTPLEAKAPIEYCYGKSPATLEYFHLSDLQSHQEAPIEYISNLYKQLQETFHEDLKHGHEKIKYEKIYESCYANDKIHIINNIIVPQDYEVLQYVRFINTPSLIPPTFRHLQIYNYVAKSDIVCYLANTQDINTPHLYDRMVATLLRLINKPIITHIYFIVTHIDKANITIKRRQALCQKIQSALEPSLPQREKQKLLEKLSFHFITAGVAHAIRCNGVSTSESGFDIATSGIVELETTLFGHIFSTPTTHFTITMLETILTLCVRPKEEIPKDFNENAVRAHIHQVKILCQEILKKLPAQYYSFYDSFANLRDNLYAQFIQALNYETRKRGDINIQKLKNSIIQSIIVGLRELAQILQSYFFSIQELSELTALLQPNNAQSFMQFAYTKEHKRILELIFKHYRASVQANFFSESNALVAEHLAYRLDILLPNSIKKTDIREDSVITPIKESFDYYFLLLERNINTLFHEKIAVFHTQAERLEWLLEACFVEYYHDLGATTIDDFDGLLAKLVSGGLQ